jgi:hypothetical protein
MPPPMTVEDVMEVSLIITIDAILAFPNHRERSFSGSLSKLLVAVKASAIAESSSSPYPLMTLIVEGTDGA